MEVINIYGIGIGGRMAGLHAAFHVFIALVVQRVNFSLQNQGILSGLVAATSLLGILLFSVPLCRRFSYELFLRIHHGLAIAYLVFIWHHLSSISLFPQIYIYVPLGVMSLISLLQLSIFLYRNNVLSSRPCPRAMVSREERNLPESKAKGDKDREIIKIRVILARAMEVKPGQYINLWMPTAFVGGPYGISKSVDQYETVLAVASNVGVAGIVPYVQQLLHGYNTSTSRVRRIHLVWQFQTLDLAISAQPLMNNLLTDDVFDDGYILEISFYVESSTTGKMTFGKHNRAVVYNGIPDYEQIISAEASGDYIARVTNIEEERGRVLVLVSAPNKLRDNLKRDRPRSSGSESHYARGGIPTGLRIMWRG